MNLMKTLAVLLLILVGGSLIAAVPTRLTSGVNDTEVVLGTPGVRYLAEMQAITTTPTTLTSTPTYVKVMWCVNTSGGAVTLSVTDAGGTKEYLPTVSVLADSAMLAVGSDTGVYMNGIRWTAGSNSALSCQVQGVQ